MKKSFVVVPFFTLAVVAAAYCAFSNQWAALITVIASAVSVSVIILSKNNECSAANYSPNGKHLIKLTVSSMTTTSLFLLIISEFLPQSQWLTYFSIVFLFATAFLGWVDYARTLKEKE